jgi:hypothetical protein
LTKLFIFAIKIIVLKAYWICHVSSWPFPPTPPPGQYVPRDKGDTHAHLSQAKTHCTDKHIYQALEHIIGIL